MKKSTEINLEKTTRGCIVIPPELYGYHTKIRVEQFPKNKEVQGIGMKPERRKEFNIILPPSSFSNECRAESGAYKCTFQPANSSYRSVPGMFLLRGSREKALQLLFPTGRAASALRTHSHGQKILLSLYPIPD